MSSNFSTLPLEPGAVARLAEHGLRFDLVDTADAATFDNWLQADVRGFHDERVDDKKLAEMRASMGYRRTTGVWDDSSYESALPIATVNSWPTDLTVPGERDVRAWAISSVTVAPTHRRRGIARSLLETELHTAHELGLPLAILTVSESTIYGRFGFAPAVFATDLSIDTQRAMWRGPIAEGRVQFSPLAELQAEMPALYARVRLRNPGAIEPWEKLWNRVVVAHGENAEKAKGLRGVRYTDADGELQGMAVYTIKENHERFSHNTLELSYLLAATDDAYAGLWRYVLEVDLVSEVTAQLRPVGEPLSFMVDDYRAVRVRALSDHLWTRILDVPEALEARSYSAPGRIALQVTDSLGYAEGVWLLDARPDGSAAVTSVDAVPDDAASLSLSVNELSALYLGGVSAATLVGAGRITEHTPGAAATVDAVFRSPATPWLSLWF